MPRMPHLARRGKRSRKSKTLGEPDVVNHEDYEAMELDSRLELIRSLIPLGLIAVCEELEREVVSWPVHGTAASWRVVSTTATARTLAR